MVESLRAMRGRVKARWLVGMSLLLLAAAPVAAHGASGSSGFDAVDRAALQRAEANGRSHVTLLIAAKEGQARSLAASIRALGGNVGARNDRVDYVRARVPVGEARRVARMNAVDAVDIDRVIPLDDPSPQGTTPTQPQTPPSAETPRTNPYMPLKDTGADIFGANPDHDGTGVKVAIVDTGVDPSHEALQETTNGGVKLVDLVTSTRPNSGDHTWVATEGSHRGRFAANRAAWIAPETGGPYAFGTLVEDQGDLEDAEYEGDLNRNGIVGETFGVLQDRESHAVIIDTNMNRDFTDDPVLTDYRLDQDYAFFGTNDPGTPVSERGVPYAVDTRRTDYGPGDEGSWFNVLVPSNSHGTHVAGIVGANGMFGGDMSGNAPGVELISINACNASVGCPQTGMTEGMLYAADNGADLANMSLGGMRVLNAGNDAQVAIYDRIVEEYGMTIFISAGNDGPGANAVGYPAYARNVIGVAASIHRDTWLSNYGQSISTENALFNFSSRGPALDGAFKPEITAPGSAVSSVASWHDGGPIPGTYPLPKGYAMYNGTSMSSPQAAGVAALLVSAYRNEFEGQTPTPTQLRRALVSTAQPIAASPMHGQGAGLVNVQAAWDFLKQDGQGAGEVGPSTIDVRVPVDHILADHLEEPGFGSGIYDRENVDAGERYTRTLTLTRTTGPAGIRSFDITVRGDLDLTLPDTVDLPLNDPVELEAEIDADDPGVHSAKIEVDDPGSHGIDHVIEATVFATEPAEPDLTFEGTVRKGGDTSIPFRVPEGTTAFKVELEGGGPDPLEGQMRFTFKDPRGMPVEQLGSAECFYPDTGAGCPVGSPTSRTLMNPLPGVWEVSVEAHRGASSQDAPFEITGSMLRADVSPGAKRVGLRGPGSLNLEYEAENKGGEFTGSLTGGPLVATKADDLTVTQDANTYHRFEVPEGATRLAVLVDGTAVAGADLDLTVYHCEPLECEEVDMSVAPGARHLVNIPDPKPGEYRSVVHGNVVPGGEMDLRHWALYWNPELGEITTDDTDTVRPNGESWGVGATITVDRVPDAGWELGGEVILTDENDSRLGSGEIGIDMLPEPPVVTLTETPPASSSARDVSFEFTVDNPDTETYCRLDDGEWEACESPHELAGLELGAHRFEVRARDSAGYGETVGYDFEITEDVTCPAVQLRLTLRGLDQGPPWGKPRGVPGVRVRMKTGRDVIARIAPRLRYRVNGRPEVVKLKHRTVRIDRARNFRFLLPRKMMRDLRRAKQQVKGTPVAVMLNARLRMRGTDPSCAQRVKVKNLRTWLIGMNRKGALRRLRW